MKSVAAPPNLVGDVRGMLPLLGVYLALSGSVAPANLAAGVLIAWGITRLVRPPGSRMRWSQIPSALVQAAVYFVVLARDVLISDLRVTRMVLTPSLPVRPGFLDLPGGTDHAGLLAATAHGITLTPGEMVTHISDDGTMRVHCLDLPASEGAAGPAQADRVRRLGPLFE